VQTANFGFLDAHDTKLVQLGGLAERYFRDDPSQLGEVQQNQKGF
jgi:type I restriction enzyme, R subunit